MMDNQPALADRDRLLIKSLDSQFHSILVGITRIDQKAHSIIVLLNGIAAVNAASHLAILGQVKQNKESGLALGIVLFGILYVLMMLIFIGVNFPQWRSIGIIKSTWENTWDWRKEKPEPFLNNLYSEYVSANQENLGVAADKTKKLKCLYRLLAVALIILMFEALYYVG